MSLRSTDPNYFIHNIARTLYGQHRVQAPQFPGVYRGYIYDNHTTNAAVCPANQARFTIPSISPDIVWGPLPYPGTTEPAMHTQCIVGFENGMTDTPLLVSLIGV